MNNSTARRHLENAVLVLGVTADRSLGLMQGLPRFLTKKGWNVHIVSSPGLRSETLQREGDTTVHALNMERDPSPLRDIRSFLAWIQLLRTVRPDVIAIGTPKAALLGSVAAWLLRVPDRVYIVRGLRLETTHGALRRVLELMERITFAASTRAVAVSPSLRNEVVQLGLVRQEKISVIGKGSSNGVDVERFHPRDPHDKELVSLRNSLGLLSNSPVIGFVGRLNSDKGLDMLSDALRNMSAKGIKFQLLLVGGQDGDTLGDPERFGVGVNVVSTGHVADTSLYYSLIDVLCLPTQREGFPNVVLEASASGVPTVTTDATGAIDSVVAGKTGLIVDKDNAEELASALTQLIDDPAQCKIMGMNARRWVMENFERKTVWRATEQYFRNGLNDHK